MFYQAMNKNVEKIIGKKHISMAFQMEISIHESIIITIIISLQISVNVKVSLLLIATYYIIFCKCSNQKFMQNIIITFTEVVSIVIQQMNTILRAAIKFLVTD